MRSSLLCLTTVLAACGGPSVAMTSIVTVVSHPGQTKPQMSLDVLVAVTTYDSNCGHCEPNDVTGATVTARPSGGQAVTLTVDSLGNYVGTLTGWSPQVEFVVHSSRGDSSYTVHTLEPLDITVTQAADPSNPARILRTLHWTPVTPPDGSVVDVCDSPTSCRNRDFSDSGDDGVEEISDAAHIEVKRRLNLGSRPRDGSAEANAILDFAP